MENNFPEYLKEDIKALKEGVEKQVLHLDCLKDEVYGSINMALIECAIDEETAIFLRKKYVGLEY